MVSCCVEGCEAKDVVYFRLPNSKTRCKKWMETIRLSSKPTYNSMVCSAHFRTEDYGVVRGKVRLKPKVLPIAQNETQKRMEGTQHDSSKSTNTDSSSNEPGGTGLNETETSGDSGELNDEMKVKTAELNPGVLSGEDQTRELDVNKSVPLESSANSEVNLNETAGDKDDIENILTHYYIKQNKEVPERRSTELIRAKSTGRCDGVVEGGGGNNEVGDSSLQKDETNPVFIEVAADRGIHDAQGSEAGDCVMLLESVQVDLDPNDLMLFDGEDVKKQSELISLLTSSDDDDVIIQEPTVETVVVSDATDIDEAEGGEDEEDVPLVRLVSSSARPRKRAPNPFYRKNGCGLYQYYCLQCPYRTAQKAEYIDHMASHSTVIIACPKCEYRTSSKSEYTKHKRKYHKKRYECHLCEYKARHRMNLVYHLKCHESVGDKCIEFKCDKCGYASRLKRRLVSHLKQCGALKYACNLCPYSSKRRYDLKRHKACRHCAKGPLA